ncbi:FAD/NAD(P)-binding oxidoreductase, partial [Brevibacterium casei]|nr:FAD/NAD(P)-binding oxidoreductase [Brevibacterium casei]
TRARVELAATDARSQKNMTRAGMGWCQGRECGYAVTCLSGRGGQAPPGAGHPERAEDAAASLSQTMKRPVAQPVPLSTFFDL